MNTLENIHDLQQAGIIILKEFQTNFHALKYT